MSELEFPRATWKSSFPESHCSSMLVLRMLQKAGTPESQKKLDCPLDLPSTLIILGPVQVSVQMEQDEQENEKSPDSTTNKDESFLLDSDPGKDWIQLKEVRKNETLGK